MKLKIMSESTIIKVVGGAMLPAKYPEDFPHIIQQAPKFLLHGTSSSHVEGIKKTGFAINNHLTNSQSLAASSAHRAVYRFGGEPVVVVVDTSHLEDLSLGGTLNDLNVLKPIPGSAIARTYKVRAKLSPERLAYMQKHNPKYNPKHEDI